MVEGLTMAAAPQSPVLCRDVRALPSPRPGREEGAEHSPRYRPGRSENIFASRVDLARTAGVSPGPIFIKVRLLSNWAIALHASR